MAAKSNQVRIIAGQWRGRKLNFPDSAGLRPTSDRIRETLFNWLAPHLPGAQCLDLFAGSGALGFEAASRGAANVVLVELDWVVYAALQAQRLRLAADSIELVCADARRFLTSNTRQFDVLFLDPPFADSELLGEVLDLIGRLCPVKPGGYLYLETARQSAIPPLPAGWTSFRQKYAGRVSYQLLSYAPALTGKGTE
jgi:16S rRNA (guanine966-N2)-methyltransferase